MATKAGDITFGVGFQVDKTGLQQVQQQLQQLQSGLKTTDIMKINNSSLQEAIQQLTKIQSTAQDVQNVMTKAFNPKIGSLNLSKFQSELKIAGHSIESIYKDFNMAGAAGQAAFRSVATQTLTANVQLKEHNKLLLDMGKTLANSFKYTVSYGVLNNLTGAIQSAFQYSKSLDSSLNDIRIVTDKSANDMERFAESANQAAKELGKSTIDYTKASLIYYQQGLADEDVEARTDVTLKAANVTGQSTAEVSEQLTAVWNGYKVSAEEAELYVDKLAAVAATTASDLEELSTGMSKVASAANSMGVDIDQLNGMLSTIVSVTRQAPESAGTALKTIFARMGDLELNGEDEFGVSLGQVSGTLDSVGIKILDATGNLRKMGKVIEEVGNKWNTGAWTDAEKQAIAIELAGKRQYNNLLALFDNWDMYNKAIETSMEAQGTLQKQQDIYMESTAAHLQQMQAAWEGVKDAILKPDDVNLVVDAFSTFGTITESLIENLGGLKGILSLVGAVGLQAFGPSIGNAIANMVNNFDIAKQQALSMKLELEAVNKLRQSDAYGKDAGITFIVDEAEKLQSFYATLDTETVNTYKNLLKVASEAKNTAIQYETMAEAAAKMVSAINGSQVNKEGLLFGSQSDEVFLAISNLDDELAKVENHLAEVGNLGSGDIVMLGKTARTAAVDIGALGQKLGGFKDSSSAVRQAAEELKILSNNGTISKDILTKNLHIIQNEIERLKGNLENFGGISAEEMKEAEIAAQQLAEQVEHAGAVLETQNITAQITSSLGALTQFSFGITSLGNALSTLFNENASIEEKFTSMFTGGLIGITTLISSVSQLSKALLGESNILTVVTTLHKIRTATIKEENVAELTSIACEKIKAAATKKKVAAIMAEIVNRKVNIASLNKETAAELINKIAAEQNIKLKDTTIAKMVQSILKLKNETFALNENTVAKLANKAASLSLVAVIGTIIAAAGVAAVAIHKYNEKLRENRIETNKTRMEALNSSIETLKSNQELIQSYKDLYHEYEISGEENKELTNKALELCDAYDLENEKILALQGNYKTLNAIIAEKERQEASQLANEARTGKNITQETAKDSLLGIKGNDALVRSDGSARVRLDSGAWTGLGSNDDEIEQLLRNSRGYTIGQGGNTFKEYSNLKELYEGLAEDLKTIQNSDIANYSSSDVYKKLKEQYDSMTESYESYLKYIDEEKQATLTLYELDNQNNVSTFNKPFKSEDYQQFKNEVDNLRDYLVTNLGLAGDELNSAVSAYLGSLDNEYAAHYQALEKFNQHLLKSDIADTLEGLDNIQLEYLISIGYTGMGTKEQLDKILSHMPDDGSNHTTITLDYIEGIKTAVSDNKLTKKEAKEYAQNLAGASTENPIAYAGFANKGSGAQFEIVQQAENEGIASEVKQMQEILDIQARQNEIINQQKDVEDVIAQNREMVNHLKQQEVEYQGESYTLAMLETEQEQLKKDILEAEKAGDAERVVELNAQLKNSEAITDAVKEQLGVFDYYNNALITATAEAERLKNNLEEASNVDFSNIELQAFDLIDQSIDTTIKKISDLTSAAELIGAGFQVAADDVEKLAKAYPEIFEGASVAAEDMMQLNKEVVQNFIQGKQEENKAEIESQIKKLQAKRELLVAERDSNVKRIEILTQYLNHDITVSQTQEQLSAELNKYKQTVDDICTRNGIDNLQQGLNANNEVSSNILQNIKTLYDAYDQLGAKAAAALAGEDYKGKMNIGSISSHNIRTWTEHSEDIDNFNGSERIQKFYQEALTQVQELAAENEILNAEIGETDTGIANLQGTLTKMEGVLGRISSGKAGKKSNKSGGSSAQPDKKDLLHAEKEIDLYHNINLELDEIEHQMKMLQKAEDKAFGKNYLDNLNTQNKLLEKQKKLLKEKLQLTANDMATRRAQLAEMGAAFDEEGYMTNYNALLTERLNKYNELVTAYNAMGTVQQKTSKQSIEDAKKEFDLLKERVSEYDKLFNSFSSLEEELQDKMDEQIENQIKAFNYEVDVRLDMAEATRNWNDFYEKVIEDIEGIEDPVKKIITSMQTGLKNFESYYNGRDGLGSIQYLTEHVRETMAQVESIKNTGTSSVYGDNMSAAVEDLKKYNDSLMENLEGAQDIINKIKDSYLDAIDEANDKLEEQTKQYEYIADLINHDMNMVELLGGEDDYADLARYYEMMHANNMQNVEFLRMQRDAIKAQLDAVEEGSEAWKKLYEQVQDAQKDLNSAVEDSLNNIIDKYSNAIKNIFDKLNKSVTSGLGLDYMQESYDRQVDNGDNYLDDPNRLYAIEKIRNKYKDALNSTSDLAAQRKIADVMAQQLKYLEEKDQLSQYEVERAEKIYDLTMKQIALQEAQANKSQLRLKRDAQGNYSYQYVADQDAMNDAQQEVNDAMNDLYNFDLENYRDILGQATELTKEYEELVTEILENAALSEEERTQRLAEVKNWYYTEMNALEEQLAINKVNLQESANMELEELYRQNNEVFQGVIFEEMVPGWNGALDEMVTNFTEDFIPRCEESMRDLEAETEKYQNDVHALEQSANQDFTAIRGGIDLTITETQSLMHSNSELIDTYYREMGAITDVLGKLDDLIHKYDDVRDAAVRMAEAASQAYQQIQLTQYKAMEAEKFVGQGNLNNYNNAVGKVTDGDGSDRNGSSSGQTKSQNPTITIQGTYYWRVESSGITAASGGPMRMNEAKEKCEEVAKSVLGDYTITLEGSTYVARKKVHVTSTYKGGKMTTQYWVGANPNYRFATGGYTGDWHSNDGKLAILDSKELVLNADDTKNMLDAVNVVRHIVASLDGSMNARVAGMAINPDISQALSQVGGASAIDQNVTISASFPNVSSHTEIEQAFENLVNRASQAAWSTRV